LTVKYEQSNVGNLNHLQRVRVIAIKKLSKSFNTLKAINDISMNVQKGEVLGILGPNGAGKTTLFRLIAGFLFPDKGTITPIGSRWPAMGYKPERLLFPNRLRVREYLQLVAKLNSASGKTAEEKVVESLARVKLSYASDKRIKECSKGMRQRLGLAQAMIGKPDLLLLDEPTNGLDPEGQTDMCQQIKELNQDGMTIIMASHHLEEVTQVCTHLTILNHGRIHYENQMKDALAERPHSTIQVNRNLEPIAILLTRLHKDIQVIGDKVILNYEAIDLRQSVLGILLSYGYDVINIKQSRVTLSEIYAEAVQ
jgi:ABC-2 type transport system ATP-binding protein